MTEHAELLKLPRVYAVDLCRPPALVLEDLTVIRLAALPAPLWMPETIFGVAVVVSDWRDPTAPAWLLPDALVPAFREALDQLDAPAPLPESRSGV